HRLSTGICPRGRGKRRLRHRAPALLVSTHALALAVRRPGSDLLGDPPYQRSVESARNLHHRKWLLFRGSSSGRWTRGGYGPGDVSAQLPESFAARGRGGVSNQGILSIE